MLAWMMILLALSGITMIVSLLMAGDSNAFSGALVGSSDLDLFKISKERGGKRALKWIMFSLGALMMIISIIIRALM